VLIDLAYAPAAGYRQNSTFTMNRKTQSVVRKLKDFNWQLPQGTGLAGGAARDLARLSRRDR
jgi:HK97 family phage major capsid protein